MPSHGVIFCLIHLGHFLCCILLSCLSYMLSSYSLTQHCLCRCSCRRPNRSHQICHFGPRAILSKRQLSRNRHKSLPSPIYRGESVPPPLSTRKAWPLQTALDLHQPQVAAEDSGCSSVTHPHNLLPAENRCPISLSPQEKKKHLNSKSSLFEEYPVPWESFKYAWNMIINKFCLFFLLRCLVLPRSIRAKN